MEKKVIKVSEVKDLVESGLTKKEIGEKFGLDTRELNLLFQHKSLKGIISRRKPISFIIEDDTVDEILRDGQMSEYSEVIEEKISDNETY